MSTLVYLADQACITLHTWLNRANQVDSPDQVMLDLDPSGDASQRLRTDRGGTLCGAASAGAPVAAPLCWEELDEPGFRPRCHTLRTMVSRVEAEGDPWAGMWRRARSPREPAHRLSSITGATHATPRVEALGRLAVPIA